MNQEDNPGELPVHLRPEIFDPPAPKKVAGRVFAFIPLGRVGLQPDSIVRVGYCKKVSGKPLDHKFTAFMSPEKVLLDLEGDHFGDPRDACTKLISILRGHDWYTGRERFRMFKDFKSINFLGDKFFQTAFSVKKLEKIFGLIGNRLIAMKDEPAY